MTRIQHINYWLRFWLETTTVALCATVVVCFGAQVTAQPADPSAFPVLLDATWTHDVPIPDELRELSEAHGLSAIVESASAGACVEAISLSQALMTQIHADVRFAFTGVAPELLSTPEWEELSGAARMRVPLDSYLAVAPPMVEVGESELHFNGRWMLLMADCSLRLGDWDQAILAASEAWEHEGPAASWRLALALIGQGHWVRARDVLATVWPSDAEIPLQVGQILDMVAESGVVELALLYQ